MCKVPMHNLKQVLIAVDQLLNAVLCAMIFPTERVWADETLSSHCWRWYLKGYKAPADVIDFVARVFGDKDHCKESYESERMGRQLPPEIRNVILGDE